MLCKFCQNCKIVFDEDMVSDSGKLIPLVEGSHLPHICKERGFSSKTMGRFWEKRKRIEYIKENALEIKESRAVSSFWQSIKNEE